MAFLPAFNGRVDIRDALQWDALRIVQHVEDVCNNPATYAVEVQSQASLVAVRNIFTAQRNQWGTPAARMFIRGGILVSYQGTQIRHDTIYDLLGWLFSVAGPAPAAALKTNYYFPLCALYSMWCRRLCANPTRVDRTGAPDLRFSFNSDPQAIEIVWFTEQDPNGSNPIKRIALGTNLDNPSTFDFKTQARTARVNTMIATGLVSAAERDANFLDMPGGGRFGQSFGHCAETLPFIYMQSLRRRAAAPKVIPSDLAFGASFNPWNFLPVDFARSNEYVFDGLEMAAAGKSACGNCQHVLPNLGLDRKNFYFPMWSPGPRSTDQ